jgi:hypothetical protein
VQNTVSVDHLDQGAVRDEQPGPLVGLLALIGALSFVFLRTRTTHFACPNCGRSFKVSFADCFFTRHSVTGRYVTYPYRHTSANMTPISGRNR